MGKVVIFTNKNVEIKFLVPLLLFALILFLLVAAISLKTNSSLIKKQLDHSGSAMASYMATTSTFYSFLDESALEGFVRAVLQDNAVVYAVFYDTEKKQITTSSSEPEDKTDLQIYEKEVRSSDGILQGYLAIGYNLNALSSGSEKFLLILAICITLALGVMIAGNSFLVRQVITKPLRDATLVARKITEGDLTVTVNLKDMAEDEIGALLEAMEQMVTKLRRIIGNVSSSAAALDESANIIAHSVQDQAIIANQQAAAVAEITSTMEELSASSAEIANHSGSVVAISNKTLADTQKGALSFATFVDKMSEIQEDNQQSIKEIVELGDKSKEIGKVMGIINNIADQTKLIAFNAALEASSAGESGKRFGVVASEIRRLADNVMDSTGEIASRIAEIKEAIQRLVVASEKGTKNIHEGVASSMETGELLSGIVAGAEATSISARQISMSTQQQKSASEQVLHAIRAIADGVQKSSESIGQITESSRTLTGLSEGLKKPIEQFELGV